MAAIEQQSLVETQWLEDHLSAPDIVLVDASWYLPTSGRSGGDEFTQSHIPGAQFLDIDLISDDASDLPHMLPSPVKFASFMKHIGIGDGVRVVAYDRDGIFASARVWWMLRVMGHRDVSVLNGGLRKWLAEGRAIESGDGATRPGVHFTPRVQSALVADIDDVKKVSDSDGSFGGQLVDARPADRFLGRTAEPRAGLRKGHIPNSANVPFSLVINDDGTMAQGDALANVFLNANVRPNDKVIATCGSGVSAAVLALALAQLGNETVAVYDGSFAEWGMADNGLRVESDAD